MRGNCLKRLFYIGIGLLLSFPLFSMTYYTMVRTSTPEFCSSCHEIEPAYFAWKTSTHVNNARGVVADCMDCHLPAPHDTYNFFFDKTMHGIKDVVSHFTGGAETYDRTVQKKHAYASIKNDQCLKCHRNLEYIPNKRGAMLAHRAVLYPRPGYVYKCTDCHRNLVHLNVGYYRYLELQPPYRSTGLPL
ncbi:MAG: cytochrome c3 family protein [Desulfovibrio sp.]|uniref:cytochrome c3 family protein n=1 Tax=Desulfovibrio sp. 7SRBS1 TaxID=3378064 RepID=UPI003B40364C